MCTHKSRITHQLGSSHTSARCSSACLQAAALGHTEMPPLLLPQPWCWHTWWAGAALLRHRRPNTGRFEWKFSAQDRNVTENGAEGFRFIRKRSKKKPQIFLHKTVCIKKQWLSGPPGWRQTVLDHKNNTWPSYESSNNAVGPQLLYQKSCKLGSF